MIDVQHHTSRFLRHRHVILGVVCVGVALAELGCNPRGPVEPTGEPRPFTPNVIAVTAPDSIAAGDSLEIKIHWISGGCLEFRNFTLLSPDDTTYRLIPVAVDWSAVPGIICLSSVSVASESFVISDPPARRFRVQVESSSGPYELRVEGGAPPATIERHWVLVQELESKDPIPQAEIVLSEISGGYSPGPVLAEITTNIGGIAEVIISCPDTTRRYDLEVVSPNRWYGRLRFWRTGARCGVPERTVIRL